MTDEQRKKIEEVIAELQVASRHVGKQTKLLIDRAIGRLQALAEPEQEKPVCPTCGNAPDGVLARKLGIARNWIDDARENVESVCTALAARGSCPDCQSQESAAAKEEWDIERVCQEPDEAFRTIQVLLAENAQLKARIAEQAKKIEAYTQNQASNLKYQDELLAQVRQSDERIAELEAAAKAIMSVVDTQADDEGLWAVCVPPNIVEAYIQQELRRLHARIEDNYAGLITSADQPKQAPRHWMDELILKYSIRDIDAKQIFAAIPRSDLQKMAAFDEEGSGYAHNTWLLFKERAQQTLEGKWL